MKSDAHFLTCLQEGDKVLPNSSLKLGYRRYGLAEKRGLGERKDKGGEVDGEWCGETGRAGVRREEELWVVL